MGILCYNHFPNKYSWQHRGLGITKPILHWGREVKDLPKISVNKSQKPGLNSDLFK